MTTADDEKVDYSAYHLVDEQMFVQHNLLVSQETSGANDFKAKSSASESFISVAGSLWRVSCKIENYLNVLCTARFSNRKVFDLTLVELPLVEPEKYAVETIFIVKKNDDYVEHIGEKKFHRIDNEKFEKGKDFINFRYNTYNTAGEYLKQNVNSEKILKTYSTDRNVVEGYKLHFAIVIRLLKVRDKNPIYSPLNIPANVDLIVDGKRFPVNNVYLSACSPVFAAMFQLDMKERNASEVEIKDVASAEHFGDFLLAFLPEQTSLPNPKNLPDLIELADRFQVASIRSNCERSLKNCVEIPLIDRILLADRHGFKNLAVYLLRTMELQALKKFYNDNKPVIDQHQSILIELVTQMSRT